MVELDEKYPGYGFAEHKGYSTDEHSAALFRHGPCPEHRYSYVNVAAVASVAVVGSAEQRRRSTVSVAADESLVVRMRTGQADLGEACEPSSWPSGDACEPSAWPSGDQGREGGTG